MEKGIVGKPKFKENDVVKFILNNYVLTGHIYIVDAYGTFEQHEEPSYDIWVDDGDYPINYPCLFKHFKESQLELIEHGTCNPIT